MKRYLLLSINYFRLFLNTLKLKASSANSPYADEDANAKFKFSSAIKYLLLGIVFGFILAYVESIIQSRVIIFSAMLNSIFTPLIWLLVGLLFFVFYTSICLKNHIMQNIGEWFGLQLELTLKSYSPAKCIYLFLFFSAIFDSYLIALFILEAATKTFLLKLTLIEVNIIILAIMLELYLVGALVLKAIQFLENLVIQKFKNNS